MKIKAIIFMANDHEKLDFTLRNFKLHNPSVPVLVYDNGLTNAKNIAKKYNCEYKKIPSIWHKETHCGIGSFDYRWFEYMFDFGLRDDDYTHVLFLETDILTLRKIEEEPKYDMAGPLFFAAQKENILFDYFGLKKYGYSFNQLGGRSAFPHTGCGGTIYRKSFFKKAQKNLPLIERVYKEKIEHCYMDLLMTYLAIISGCTFGPWRGATNICGEYVLDKETGFYRLRKADWSVALMHKVKYKNEMRLRFDIIKSKIGYDIFLFNIYLKIRNILNI